MAWTGRFLLPIRKSVSAVTTSSSSVSSFRHQFSASFGNSKKWVVEIIEPALRNHSYRVRCNLGSLRGKYVSDSCFSGPRVFGGCLVASVLYGSIGSRPHFSYSMDGQHVLVDREEDTYGFNMKEDQQDLWMLVKKFWPPILFIFTLLVGWDDPIMLAARVVLFLLSTRPSPSSIYLLVEQLRHQLMRREPLFYRLRSLYASKVEVQDYKLLCVARVEVGSQKLNVLGILGGWWVLPSSGCIFPPVRGKEDEGDWKIGSNHHETHEGNARPYRKSASREQQQLCHNRPVPPLPVIPEITPSDLQNRNEAYSSVLFPTIHAYLTPFCLSKR